ncbi:hypothetical protein GWK47_010632 [Chionoecetes opilio]|uniref:Uncharacterized protein n=1 Tax=Chionoecetes opilio TaxID=41210 RepID=A0A8J4XW51_CHIOP|nr:hypothetical protein GWK47_010632 [Chionoecetes opilio]
MSSFSSLNVDATLSNVELDVCTCKKNNIVCTELCKCEADSDRCDNIDSSAICDDDEEVHALKDVVESHSARPPTHATPSTPQRPLFRFVPRGRCLSTLRCYYALLEHLSRGLVLVAFPWAPKMTGPGGAKRERYAWPLGAGECNFTLPRRHSNTTRPCDFSPGPQGPRGYGEATKKRPA